MFDRATLRQPHAKMDAAGLQAYIAQHMPGLVPKLQALMQHHQMLGGGGGGGNFAPWEQPQGGQTPPPGVTPYPQGGGSAPRPGGGVGSTLTPRFERPMGGGMPPSGMTPYGFDSQGPSALLEALKRRG